MAMEMQARRWSWRAVGFGWLMVFVNGKVAKFGDEMASASDAFSSALLDQAVTMACLPLVFALAILAPIAERAAHSQPIRGDGWFFLGALLFAIWPLVPGLAFPLWPSLPPELVRVHAMLPFVMIGATSCFAYARDAAVARAKSSLACHRRAWRTRSPSRAVQQTLQRIVVATPQDPAAAQREASLLAQWLQAAAIELPASERTLQAELAMLEPFLELQRLRFAGRAEITVEAAPDVEKARMPDALLLPLVEHSIERAIAPRGTGSLRIAVRPDGRWLVLEIADDGPPPTSEGEPKDADSVPAATIRQARELSVPEAWLVLRRNERGGTTTWVRVPLAFVGQAA